LGSISKKTPRFRLKLCNKGVGIKYSSFSNSKKSLRLIFVSYMVILSWAERKISISLEILYVVLPQRALEGA